MLKNSAGPVTLLLVVSLGACGGSGGSSTTKTTPATASGAGSRQAAIDCLRKHGVNVGQGTGFSQQSFQAARQACAQYFPRGALRLATPAQRAKRRAAYAAVQSCMSKHGYKLPSRGLRSTRPSGTPGPGGAPGASAPAQGFGGGRGFGAGAALQAALSSPAGRTAVRACRPQIAALRPPGGGGGGAFLGPGSQ